MMTTPLVLGRGPTPPARIWSWQADPTRNGHSLTAGWAWDGQNLSLWNDRLGFSPLCMATGAGWLVIGTDPAAVAMAAGKPRLDDDAIAAFLWSESFWGEDTPFAGVRMLAPGETLRWSAIGGVQSDIPPLPCPAAFAGSEGEAIAFYGDALEAAVAARVPETGNLRLPLSGGRDSRHLLLAAQALGLGPLPLATIRFMEPSASEDLRVARLLAARVGWPFHNADIRWSRLIADQHARDQATGHMAMMHEWAPQLCDLLQSGQNGPVHVLDGLAGDSLSNGLFSPAPLRAALARSADSAQARLAADLFLPATCGMAPVLNGAALRRWSRERAVTRLQTEAARHANMPNPGASFVFWNRTRRLVSLAPTRLYPPVLASFPYLDPALFDFFLSLPHERFGDAGFHDRVIAARYPAFADIGYERKGGKARNPVARALAWQSLGLALRAGPFAARGRLLRLGLAAALTGDGVGAQWWAGGLTWLTAMGRFKNGD